MPRIDRRTSPVNLSASFAVSTGLAFFCLVLLMPAAWCAKVPSKTVTTVDGRPIRKVYIHSASPAMARSAAYQLTHNTCLIEVPDSKQADAVLDVGIALPVIGSGGVATPGVFGPSARAQTAGNDQAKPQRSVSATCSDSRAGSGGCNSSYSVQGGEIAPLPAAGWRGDAGANLDVSLASPEKTAQELWEPDARSKKTWSDQLRIAAGCPVCPDGHFDRHKDKSYRDWIQAKCPSIVAAQ